MRVSGQSARSKVLEKTTFGISFIGRANSLSDVGQVAAISSYVTRPIRWAPAPHTDSSTQRLVASSCLA
jgi:hypothetical protein